MEQSRRLALLEKRLDAIDAARRADRDRLMAGLDLLADALRELGAQVHELELGERVIVRGFERIERASETEPAA